MLWKVTKALQRGLLIGLLAALLPGCVPVQSENAFEASIVLFACAGEDAIALCPELCLIVCAGFYAGAYALADAMD